MSKESSKPSYLSLIEQVLQKDSKEIKKGTIATIPEQNQLDVSKISLDESKASDLMSQCFGVKSEVRPKHKISPPQKIKESDLETKLQIFVTKFSQMLIEGKELINEMTTCGMIGTAQAPTHNKIKKKKKRFNVKI